MSLATLLFVAGVVQAVIAVPVAFSLHEKLQRLHAAGLIAHPPKMTWPNTVRSGGILDVIRFNRLNVPRPAQRLAFMLKALLIGSVVSVLAFILMMLAA